MPKNSPAAAPQPPPPPPPPAPPVLVGEPVTTMPLNSANNIQAVVESLRRDLEQERAARAEAERRANEAETSRIAAEQRADTFNEAREDALKSLRDEGDARRKFAELFSLNALRSAAGKAWLEEQLAAAQREVESGPQGSGWQYNETLRDATEERAAFLGALHGLLDSADLAD